MKKLICIIGSPGAGKTYIADKLVEAHGWASARHITRLEGSDIAKTVHNYGTERPTEMVESHDIDNAIMAEILESLASGGGGVLISGYPRTMGQLSDIMLYHGVLFHASFILVNRPPDECIVVNVGERGLKYDEAAARVATQARLLAPVIAKTDDYGMLCKVSNRTVHMNILDEYLDDLCSEIFGWINRINGLPPTKDAFSL